MSETSIQRELEQAYQRLAELYDRAHEITGALPAIFDGGSHAETEVKSLAGLMDQISRLEGQTLPLRAKWEAEGCVTDMRLDTAKDRVRTSLTTLIDSTRRAEQHAESAKAKLTPS